MDGSGAWRDNVFVEQLWKSVKSERVYLHAYDSVNEEEVLLKVGLHFHARQARRGRREVKQLQTCLGRVYRDIVRKIEDQSIFQVTGFAISY